MAVARVEREGVNGAPGSGGGRRWHGRGGHSPPSQAGVDGMVLPIADDPLPLRPGEKRATDREVSAFRGINGERGGVDGDAQRRQPSTH